jgi:hypothetical protein
VRGAGAKGGGSSGMSINACQRDNKMALRELHRMLEALGRLEKRGGVGSNVPGTPEDHLVFTPGTPEDHHVFTPGTPGDHTASATGHDDVPDHFHKDISQTEHHQVDPDFSPTQESDAPRIFQLPPARPGFEWVFHDGRMEERRVEHASTGDHGGQFEAGDTGHDGAGGGQFESGDHGTGVHDPETYEGGGSDSLIDHEYIVEDQDLESMAAVIEPAWHSLADMPAGASIDEFLREMKEILSDPPLKKKKTFDDQWDALMKTPEEWMRIENPTITRLLIKDEKWKYICEPKYNPKNRSLYMPLEIKGGYSKDDKWRLQDIQNILNRVSTAANSNHSIRTREEVMEHFRGVNFGNDRTKLYVPHGLDVFKPLCKDMFAQACEQLRNLFEVEDLDPTPDISPDRMSTKAIPGKTFLFYSYNDKKATDPIPARRPKNVVRAIRERGFPLLAEYVMKHISTMIRATNTDISLLDTYGSVMFIRYNPGADFNRHIDGIRSLGKEPGPILNVAMGIEGAKIIDFMPVLCYVMPDGTLTYKYPLRVHSQPGEGVLMWGESRVEYLHCIPSDDYTTRYTMAIKLPGPPRPQNLELIETRMLFPWKDAHVPVEYTQIHATVPNLPAHIKPQDYRVVYKSYALMAGSYKDVSIFDTEHDIVRIPVFNHRQRQLVTLDPPRKHADHDYPPRKRADRDDDTVSVASTKSARSTASEQGTRMRPGEQGFIYMDKVLPPGQRQGWDEKERWQGSGTWNEGGYNAYPPRGGGGFGGYPPRGGGGFGGYPPRGRGGFGGGKPRGGGAFRGGNGWDGNHNHRQGGDGVFRVPRPRNRSSMPKSLYLCYT